MPSGYEHMAVRDVVAASEPSQQQDQDTAHRAGLFALPDRLAGAIDYWSQRAESGPHPIVDDLVMAYCGIRFAQRSPHWRFEMAGAYLLSQPNAYTVGEKPGEYIDNHVRVQQARERLAAATDPAVVEEVEIAALHRAARKPRVIPRKRSAHVFGN